MKVGILGGTFNPIHNGHLMLADYAKETFNLDEVWFLPNGMPPHKYGHDNTGEGLTHRINMVKLAIEECQYFKLSMAEARTDDFSYTYSTLKTFNRRYPTYKFYFIVGADSLFSIEKWMNFTEIFQRCTILAALRGENSITSMVTQIKHLENVYRGKIEVLQAPTMEISSSDIRSRVKEGESISYMVPEKVVAYIRENNLYGATLNLKFVGIEGNISKGEDYHQQKYDFERFDDILKERLTKERYLHTQGVMHTAAVLAMKYQVNIYDAMTAGLLHDCGKYPTMKEQLEKIRNYDIVLSHDERENPSLIHAPLGAYLAKHEFGVTEEPVLAAIHYHTTGRPEMTMLEKIIYIADFIEPYRGDNRKFRKVRDLSFTDINRAICECAKLVIAHLVENNRKVGDMTIQTLKYYGGKNIDTD